ncbi:hypothetical protein [Sutterella sp.]|uniref:hypothetical protein n=1 Tax=Sutterella sp. TaxID=1981025 RepID=UPI003FD74CD6
MPRSGSSSKAKSKPSLVSALNLLRTDSNPEFSAASGFGADAPSLFGDFQDSLEARLAARARPYQPNIFNADVAAEEVSRWEEGEAMGDLLAFIWQMDADDLPQDAQEMRPVYRRAFSISDRVSVELASRLDAVSLRELIESRLPAGWRCSSISAAPGTSRRRIRVRSAAKRLFNDWEQGRDDRGREQAASVCTDACSGHSGLRTYEVFLERRQQRRVGTAAHAANATPATASSPASCPR